MGYGDFSGILYGKMALRRKGVRSVAIIDTNNDNTQTAGSCVKLMTMSVNKCGVKHLCLKKGCDAFVAEQDSSESCKYGGSYTPW